MSAHLPAFPGRTLRARVAGKAAPMRSLLASLACLSLLLPGVASAGIEKAGTTGASFLSVGAGADVLGMGGTTLGFGSGLGAASWNVAALGNLNGSEYVFSHAALTGESPQDWVAAGGRFGASHTHWGLTGLYEGDGSFEGRDASNNPTASFNASSMALGFQLAQGFGSGSSIGVGMKYATEKLGDVTGGGVTFDAGLRLQAGPFGFGAAAQNAFGKMSYSGVAYDFPTNYGAGVAFTIPSSGVTLAVDANFPNAYYTDVRGGVEWRYRDRLALRTGYRKEMDATDGEPLGGPTFGMGAGANGFWLDYGFVTGGASGSGQHRVALTYRPGFLNGGAQAALTQPEPRVTHVSAPKAARVEAPKPEKTAKTTAPVIEAPKAAVVEAPKSSIVAAPKAESAPIRSESPKAAAPAVVEAPKSAPAVVAPKPAAAKATEAPKATETPKAAETPKALVPVKVDAPKPAAPPAKSDVAPAKSEATPKPVAPKAEAPKAEAPRPEAVKPAPVEAKPVETKPAVEAPKAESPAPPPAPVVEAPKAPAPSPAPAPAPEKAKDEPRPEKVKVKDGETLADIAKRWGNSVPAIMMENNMVRETVKPGQTLKLPPKGR